MGATVSASVAVIAKMTAQITGLERQLTADFEAHPDAEVVRSLPGPGTVRRSSRCRPSALARPNKRTKENIPNTFASRNSSAP